MKKRIKNFLSISLLITFTLLACGNMSNNNMTSNTNLKTNVIEFQDKIVKLENNLFVTKHEGDDGFTSFLAQGGASSDNEVIQFLAQNMILSKTDLQYDITGFGCSTISAVNENDEHIFGRNFDWYNCEAMIVYNKPTQGYASISTSNMNFIKLGGIASIALSSKKVKALAAIYAPLDGMNEKGLCISVNMIQDSATINQNTNKPDITTTTAVRLILNQAANVDEAIELLQQHDLHASMGWMIHFSLSDKEGNSAVVEYIDNQIVVTKTEVVTNFYLAQGKKYGIGTSQSRDRYNILTKTLETKEKLSMDDVKAALESVSKHHYNDGETTEWSIIYNKETGEVQYYHRENFNQNYVFNIYENNANEAVMKNNKISIVINDKKFTATLQNNETAKNFVSMLPMTLQLKDLNSNEKYTYMTTELKKDNATKPGKIKSGDIMCFSSDCLVLFYKSFSTSYSYVPIAHVDDITQWEQTIAAPSSIQVTFATIED